MKNYISKNFKVAFGQHSGVIDINKDKFELPRFPINEKYGNLKRFKSLISYLPLEYKKFKPNEKKLKKNNPPELIIEFFDEQTKYLILIVILMKEIDGINQTLPFQKIYYQLNLENLLFQEEVE